MEETNSNTTKYKFGLKFWLCITLVYALIIISFLVINPLLNPNSPSLGLNGIGDYLAGTFSPVAFAWLVYGYLMQSKELKNNTLESQKAHNLARDQLSFQKKVKQYELAKEHNKSQPIISLSLPYEMLLPSGGGNYEQTIFIENLAAEAINLHIKKIIDISDDYPGLSPKEEFLFIHKIDSLKKDKKYEFTINISKDIYKSTRPFSNIFDLQICFHDKLNKEQSINVGIYHYLKNGTPYLGFVHGNTLKELPEI